MVDKQHLKCCDGNIVRVRVSPAALRYAVCKHFLSSSDCVELGVVEEDCGSVVNKIKLEIGIYFLSLCMIQRFSSILEKFIDFRT